MTVVPNSGTIALIMGTACHQESLSSLLFGKTRRAVLALLYGRPEESFYMRQVARAAGTGQGSVQRELKRMADIGIIVRARQGQHVYYQANRRCPIFAELRGLIAKTAGLADTVRKALSVLAEKIDVAIIYGSQATGEATADSDVDLLVVGDLDEIALHRAIAKAEKDLGRTVTYTLFSPDEFSRRRKEKGGFLARALGGKTIAILGDPGEV